jgi:hypothetical protein
MHIYYTLPAKTPSGVANRLGCPIKHPSMDPPEWICPLLAVEIDAFNHGGTPEFAAISAVAVRHNAIVETLTNAPKTFEPIFVRKPGKDIDAVPGARASTPQ